MKVQLKKDVKINESTKLHKATEGVLIGISWGDNYSGDMYHIEIKDKRYVVDKRDCDLYGS